jgi:hypothetical protein
MQSLKSKIKRFIVKVIIYLRKKTNPKSLDENSKICMNICRKLIRDKNSKFLIAPISGKKYIKNSELGLFVIMDGGKISVTNHVYHYDIYLDMKEWERISKIYDARTESDRQIYENEIHNQIEFSLQSILDKVSDKTQPI